MNRSLYEHTCELATRMAVLEPKDVATLGDVCLVQVRKEGGLSDFAAPAIRRLGNQCITHCLARKLAQ